MSTHRQELLDLQAKAERAGRTVLLNVDDQGRIDSVFYRDPKAGATSLSRTGITLSPISFAEIEREKPVWYKMPESFEIGSTLGGTASEKAGTITIKTPPRKIRGRIEMVTYSFKPC